MRISDLIPNRDFLLTRAYYNGQNAIAGRGTSAPDIANHVTELDWNYAVIQRLSKDDLTTKLIPFALGQAIADPGSIENKELEPGDVVVIYSQSDLTLPQALQAKFVTIEGQVMAPGTYRVGDGETLRSLVQRAGGFAPHAYLYASELTRTSVLAEQVKKLHQLEEQEGEEVLSPSNTGVSKITGLTSTDPSAELDLRRAYIARLNDVHPTGRIVLRLRPEANGIQDVPDFVLEDGDHFTVPVVPNTVEVLGNVYNQGAMRYLNTAGGANREADKKREFVIRADGTIVSRQQISDIDRTIIYPGDVVVVPPKLKSPAAFDINAFAQLLSSLALGFAAIKTLQ
jgi:protein involved in polysaccharide export with SLBB domain